MSDLKALLIPVENMTDTEQLDLWWTLHDFAQKKLPFEKDLMILTVDKKQKGPEGFTTLEEDLAAVFKKRNIDVQQIVVENGASKYTVLVKRT